MKKILFSLSAISMLFSANVLAEEIVDSVTGVNYEVNEDGSFARIRAVGEAELMFGDRKDIRIATQKASLRAKASIAKFLNERVTSEEVIDNVEKVVSQTDGDKITANRETIENHMESIRNSAEALLKGVITTKTDVNKDEKYVEVEVGISEKTMRAADTLNQKLNSDLSEKSLEAGKPLENGGSGREIKKSKNYDNF